MFAGLKMFSREEKKSKNENIEKIWNSLDNEIKQNIKKTSLYMIDKFGPVESIELCLDALVSLLKLVAEKKDFSIIEKFLENINHDS